jgi:diaminopimelate epimerase
MPSSTSLPLKLPLDLPFAKMHGAGNDFVVIDGTKSPVHLTREQLQKLGDRRLGVGADQILVVDAAPDAGVDFGYRIFNGASGDEVEHCGNGARCFVRFVHDRGLTTQSSIRVRTMNNVLTLQLHEAGRVSVDMNVPRLLPGDVAFDVQGLVPKRVGEVDLWALDGLSDVQVALVSMGNPHAVQLVPDVQTAPVASQGPLVERHRRFAAGVNAGYLQVIDRRHARLRVWERHAGETLSCGTGACAAMVVGRQMGLLDAKVDVQTRGGMLSIEWAGPGSSVIMTGPTENVYQGVISL